MRWLNNQFFYEEFQSFAAGESSFGLPGLGMDSECYGQKLTRWCYAEGFYAQPKFSPAKNPHWMVTLERIAPADTPFLPFESHLLAPKDNICGMEQATRRKLVDQIEQAMHKLPVHTPKLLLN